MDEFALAGWVGREILPHERDLRAWLSRAMPRAMDAEDIVQECYCRLATLKEVASIREPRAFLFTMARNLALKQLRRAKVVSLAALTAADLAEQGNEFRTPERIMCGQESLSSVQEALMALSERCRKIILLRRVEGLSQREVAAQLGITEHIVENEIRRGVKALMRHLEASEAVPDDIHPETVNEHARKLR